MPIEIIQSKEPEYRITNRPGFEDMIFTESSGDWLALPHAVAYAKERDSVLQSAREAAAFRIEANGRYGSNEGQPTRTTAAYVKLDGKWCVAFDDAPEVAHNIILARAQEGYCLHSWRLRKNDEYVKGILSRAERDDRIYEVVDRHEVVDRSLVKLATKSVKGASQFGSHPSIQALLGDVSEDYAAFLSKQGYSEGFVFVLPPEALEGIGDRAEIRWADLGVVGVFGGGVGAGLRFGYGGRARGVRHARKLSNGNEGSLECVAKESWLMSLLRKSPFPKRPRNPLGG